MFPVVPMNVTGTKRPKLMGERLQNLPWPGEDRTSRMQSGRSMSLEVWQHRRMTFWLVLQRGLQEVTGRTHGLRKPSSPQMLRSFTPHSGALSSSPRLGSQICRGPGVLPSEEGKFQPGQVEPELHPVPLRLLSPPPPTLSGPGLDRR